MLWGLLSCGFHGVNGIPVTCFLQAGEIEILRCSESAPFWITASEIHMQIKSVRRSRWAPCWDWTASSDWTACLVRLLLFDWLSRLSSCSQIEFGLRGWSFITCEGGWQFCWGVTFQKLVACGGPSLNSWHPLGGSFIVEISRFHGHHDGLCCGTDQTGVTFEKFLMHFQPFKRLKFQKFPRGSMPPNPPSQQMLVRSSSVPMMRSCRLCTLCRLILWNGAMVANDDQDELTQLLKYEKHELYRNALRAGFSLRWCCSIFSFYSTRIYSLLCSDHWTQISEFKDRYEGLLSQITALKCEDVFSSCGERGGVGVIFILLFCCGGSSYKTSKGFGGLALKCCKTAAPPPPPPPPSLTGNKRPAPKCHPRTFHGSQTK